jgi:hypothetical protein
LRPRRCAQRKIPDAEARRRRRIRRGLVSGRAASRPNGGGGLRSVSFAPPWLSISRATLADSVQAGFASAPRSSETQRELGEPPQA